MLIKRLSISDPYKMDISKLLEAAEANNQKVDYDFNYNIFFLFFLNSIDNISSD